MDTQTVSPQNIDERIVWAAITGTYGFYLLGALYVVAPAIAWILLVRLLWRRWNTAGPGKPVPLPVLVWIIGMLVMLLSLIIGHLVNDLGIPQLIKSTIGWAKGWALLAIFPLVSLLDIRPQLIIRACMVVCRHTLWLLPVFIGAWALGVPETLYVSPLKVIGGPGPEFFALSLYEIDPGSGMPRWRMFTPWAPALGMVANIFFLLALSEKDSRWRRFGVIGSVAMILMSGSRLAIVSLVLVWCMVQLLTRLHRPGIHLLGAPSIVVLGLIGEWILQSLEYLWEGFRAARADSTRVREALARIALERWRSEAPLWGHGIVERGPHLVEYMPVGSHHSWYGLLFVKGLVGLLALAIPMLVSFVDLLMRAHDNTGARTALGLVLLLFLYTFGENLEILAYLFWPALILIGIGHQRAGEAVPAASATQANSSVQLPAT